MPPELLHFLLVEDDDDHAGLVQRCFSKSRLGNTIDRVVDGVEALAYLRREDRFAQSPRPGAILLDLNLPKLSGHEVLKAIKNDPVLAKIPVVILTTSAAEIDRAKAYSAHANSYLVKPVDFEQFKKLVDDLNLYWGVWNVSNTVAA